MEPRGGVLLEADGLKTLLLDIETAPNVAHVWGLWQQNVGLNQILASGYVMCWAAKWYGKRGVMFDSMHASTPKKMLRGVHKLLDEADVVVHYNGTKFDIPTLNKEFVMYEFKPPAPYKQVDLYVTAQKQFRFPSNKLEYIAKALGLGEKTRHEGHELWVRCMAGDEAAWKRMEAYNKNDVELLEPLYDRMAPWVRTHPNHGLYDEPGVPVCPTCGSTKLQRRGFARTQVNKYARYQCVSCGTWSRGGTTELPKEDRQLILRKDLG